MRTACGLARRVSQLTVSHIALSLSGPMSSALSARLSSAYYQYYIRTIPICHSRIPFLDSFISTRTK